MHLNDKIFVAGHRGLVGSAIVRRLRTLGYVNVITADRHELDLRDQAAVFGWFSSNRPDYVFLAAAKVGGIAANSEFPADFLFENLAIQNAVIHSAWRSGVRKLLFLGSSCIYPKYAQQPINEDALLTGALEPTNEAYAVAKIAGIKLCQALRDQYGFDAISLMPTNLYGPGDYFHASNSHVIPGLIRRFDEAKHQQAPSVQIWGSGTPRREFLHVDDLADACVHLMKIYSDRQILNVGVGADISIIELARLVAKVTGFEGELTLDPSKPDGTPRKLLDVGRLTALGWCAKIPLEEGLAETYRWFVQNREKLRLGDGP